MNVDPDALYAYVGNVEKVPQYVPHVIDAHRVEGGSVSISTKQGGDGGPAALIHEAWLRLLPGRHVEWGVSNLNNYHGEASVVPTDAGSMLLVTLHLEQADPAAVNRELKDALQTIKRIVEGGRRS